MNEESPKISFSPMRCCDYGKVEGSPRTLNDFNRIQSVVGFTDTCGEKRDRWRVSASLDNSSTGSRMDSARLAGPRLSATMS
jgi:hypothetical protein